MSYPHTIDDGAGSSLTFVRRTRDERGEYLETENSVAPGKGPPMHVHHFQEEGLTVRRGRIGWQVRGDEPQEAGEGESVHFSAGVAHRFWNAGEDRLVCTGYIRPPDNIEYFLARMYESTARHGGKRPGIFDAAWLATHYRSEFDTYAVPAPVKRFLFPVVLAVGRLLGRDKAFVDAPEPRRA